MSQRCSFKTPHRPKPHRHQKPGVILILILGVLTLLVIIGTVFISLAWIDNLTTKSYVDVVRARLLSRSGLEMALVNLEQEESQAMTYGLQFTDSNKNGRYDVGEPIAGAASSIPLEYAQYPSLKGQGNVNNPDAAEITVQDINGDGTADTIGYSGYLPPTYDGGADIYALRIADCSSMIFVNGPGVSDHNPAVQKDSWDWSLAPCTKRMLNNLLPRLGDVLSDKRRALRRDLASREEVKDAILNGGLTEADYDSIQNFITCYSWVNDKTLLPGALKSTDLDPGGNPLNPTYRWSGLDIGLPGVFGMKSTLLNHLHIPKFLCCPDDVIMTNKIGMAGVATPPLVNPGVAQFASNYVLQPRAPININTAPIEVLVAVLTGLKGYNLDRTVATPTIPGAYTYQKTNQMWPALSKGDAVTIANEIIDYRNKTKLFYSFNDFSSLLNSLEHANPPVISDYQRQLIEANANPNSHLARFNPNKVFGIRYGDMDKSSLGGWIPGSSNDNDCGWSTEFCFFPTGYFEIDALGRVLSPPMAQKSGNAKYRKIMAQSKTSAIVKIYDILQQTTQKDFEKYADTKGYNLADMGFTTFPESIVDLKSSPTLWNEINNDCFSKDESSCNHELCYDGYVTLKPLDDSFIDFKPPIFDASFNDSLNGISISGSGANLGPAVDDRSVLDKNCPSQLFPDGVFLHETRRSNYNPDYQKQPRYGYKNEPNTSIDRYIKYPAAGNFQTPGRPLEGSLEFWYKPTWNPDEIKTESHGNDSTDYHYTKMLFSMGYGEDIHNTPIPPSPDCTQRFAIFVRNDNGATNLNLLFGDTLSLNAGKSYIIPTHHTDTYGAFKYGTAQYSIDSKHLWRAGEWHHIAASWSQTSATLYVDGSMAERNNPLIPMSAFATGILADWGMYLGCNRFEDGNANTNFYPLEADGTFDSFKIYSVKKNDESFIPPNRYDPSGATYSALFPANDFPVIKDGGRVGKAYWTAYVPDGGSLEFTINNIAVPATTTGYADVNSLVAANSDLKYQVKFTPALINGVGSETPILDDLMLTFISQPRFISYAMDNSSAGKK